MFRRLLISLWIAFAAAAFAAAAQAQQNNPLGGPVNQPPGGGSRVNPVPLPDPGHAPVTLPQLPQLPSLPLGPAPLAPGAFFDNQVLLLVPIGSPPGAPQQIAAPLGMGVLREFDLATIGLHGAVLSLPSTLDVVTAIEFLTLTPNALAQPVYRYGLTIGPQYALDMMQVDAAHQYATGSSVTVAVIDTAVDVGHPAIAARIAGIQDFIGAGAPDVHGTAVAGLIAGAGDVAGVAPGARILAVTAFPGGGADGATDRIAQAIDYAVAAGAQVLNMSFAGPADPVVAQLVQAALARGRTVVAAAGNGGPSAAPSWPAAVPGVIAVTATGPADEAYSSANRGSYITIAAPGVDVLPIAPQGRVGILSGTSMAAAHVSGLVALILERYPGANPAQVRALLERTAHDLGAPGRDTVFGAGLVDALTALQTGL
ncbi:MAG: S8 family serine peptidase [Alphaproteobacteria bacterium]